MKYLVVQEEIEKLHKNKMITHNHTVIIREVQSVLVFCEGKQKKQRSQVHDGACVTAHSGARCLTFLLEYLESLLGLAVQVLQVLRPAPFDEHILLVVLRCCVVHGQPPLLLSPLQSSWQRENIGEA